MIKINESNNKKETITVNIKGYGQCEIPTLTTIKKNLIDLYNIMKNCKSWDDARKIQDELKCTIEVGNSDLGGNPLWYIDNYGDDEYTEENTEWYRVDTYGFLDFIYCDAKTGKPMSFDVWMIWDDDDYGTDLFIPNSTPQTLDSDYKRELELQSE